MTSAAVEAIRNEIERKQSEIDALRTAFAALAGAGKAEAKRGKGARRPRTEAEKAALSKAMKAAWRRRKAETTTKSVSQKRAGKGGQKGTRKIMPAQKEAAPAANS